METTREGRRFAQALGLIAALIVLFGLWIDVGLGGSRTARYVDDLATIAAALAAALLCLRAATQHDGRLRLFWSLLAAACFAWTLGELIWGLYDLVGGDVPVASWADAAYLAALPATVAALIVHPALRGRAVDRTRSVVDGLVLAVSVFFVAWTLVFEPLQRTTGLSSLDDVVTLAYPVGDVVIVFLVVLVLRGTTSTDQRDLRCLLAGLFLITLSDGLYSYLTNVQNYSSGDMIDTGWFAGYLVIALAAFCSRSPVAAERPAAAAPSLSPAAIVTPFLAMLAALSLAAVELELGRPLDHVTLVAAFVLVGLVLIRQGLLAVDLFAPGADAEAGIADRLVAALGEAVADPGAPRKASP
jgi:hypothetical protein